ncbi:ribosomal assembly complex component Ipi3, putative [Talaromyces stipitatus ATCC 10500]|uniref:Pre-rRNA-processing protein IPI3 n=1 Tax=Talaromyces stipitatus (strain ATCC 10500 / CBS 375.48 / QM 6759 / NRRL 1006) TaxID=441959 RepID=B8MLU3_TALSN|nr:ribosomal assembly complex component Ipi3, putative [Talaromyces stipitatus ATCC 10500]EED13869.1 ribosomal assembly complex component Ipi3, putative [Talaromyces stipitatus ATCC 10500]
MLSVTLIASLLGSSKTQTSSTLRDAGICVQDLLPTSALRATFKKSSTPPNGLAVTSTHIFAAQIDKSVVHVYSRLKGNQEATVPFPERIRSLAVAGGHNGEILILGTEGGRLILWETCTGRQVSTTPSHLRPVTSLVVDPTSNIILSGSADANVHIWSIPQLLSFSRPVSTGQDQKALNSPIRTFGNHRTPITALAIGHGSGRSNIAISAAQDSTAVVWEYATGKVLRTFLLPSVAISITVDPADRACYVGYESGNVQRIGFYETMSAQHPLYDQRLQNTPSQLNDDQQWTVPSADKGATTALALSYDGMTLYSGHPNGSVLSWDIARGKFSTTIADYMSPVTNLHMLPPVGFPAKSNHDSSRFTIPTIVKPRYEQNIPDKSLGDGIIPFNYALNVQLVSPASKTDVFSEALTHPVFPTSLLEEGLAELAALNDNQDVLEVTISNGHSTAAAVESSQLAAMEEEITTLKKQLSINEAARRADAEETVKLKTSIRELQDSNKRYQHLQAKYEQLKVVALAEKEDRDLEQRKAWFESEKAGVNGDGVLREARAAYRDLDEMGE